MPRKLYHLLRIFKGRQKRFGHHKNRGALRILNPYLCITQFQGFRSLQRKENSSRNLRRRLRNRLCYHIGFPCGKISVCIVGNINPIPFCLEVVWADSKSENIEHYLLVTELPVGLGPLDPCSTAVHMEPFSTSVYKVLTCIFATTTKICSRGRSTRTHVLRFNATTVSSLLGITFEQAQL